jgi:hypothetical protein
MPEICDECREEKGYDKVNVFTCDAGYEHCICNDCMKAIKRKAKLMENKDV